MTAADAPDTPRGGIARAMSMHAHALAELGVEQVHVITLSADHRSHSFRDGLVHVHRIPDAPVIPPPDMLYLKLAAWSSCVAEKYAELDAVVGFDIVEAPDWYGEALHLERRQETPLVVSLHSLSGVISPHNGRPASPGGRVWDELELLSLERADHVIAPTQLVFDDSHALLRDRMPPASLIPLPFDANRFPARSGRPQRSGPLTVSFVGRIEPRKGTDLALRVAAAARDRGLAVRLELLGRQSPQFARDVVLPLMSELGLSDVEWFGELSEQEVGARVRDSDCVLLPSRWDNFHMAAVEALSSGVPVITTERNGLASWFDRDSGLLALSLDDESAFVDMTVDALTDRAWLDTAGAAAAARVRHLLDPASVARQVLAVYEHVVQSRRSAPSIEARDASGSRDTVPMPPSPTTPPSRASSALHEQALQAFSAGRHTDARLLTARGLEEDGAVTRLNDLAVIMAEDGQVAEAKALLAACLVIRPEDRDALANLELIEQLSSGVPATA